MVAVPMFSVFGMVYRPQQDGRGLVWFGLAGLGWTGGVWFGLVGLGWAGVGWIGWLGLDMKTAVSGAISSLARAINQVFFL